MAPARPSIQPPRVSQNGLRICALQKASSWENVRKYKSLWEMGHTTQTTSINATPQIRAVVWGTLGGYSNNFICLTSKLVRRLASKTSWDQIDETQALSGLPKAFPFFLPIPLIFSYPAVRRRSASTAVQVLSVPHGAGSAASCSKSSAATTSETPNTSAAAAAWDTAASASSSPASTPLPVLLDNVV